MDKTAEIPDCDHFFRKTAAKWENVLMIQQSLLTD